MNRHQPPQPPQPTRLRWASPYAFYADPAHGALGAAFQPWDMAAGHVTQWPLTLRPQPDTDAADRRHNRWPAAGPYHGTL
ncbi:hypothetical protein pkur_cds_201 [Pandoravirus kuranda]|uniref:Uncharacterized protein n=1 Tax=Pandoravirus kuranda TaxID=3019033 RepID=A0AA95EC65_9VIRU|nr:hypothetical protein pkur_cds_201 [Pandoravirus kuranda]